MPPSALTGSAPSFKLPPPPRDGAKPPLYLRHPDVPHWLELLPEQHAVYAQYNQVQNAPSLTVAQFADSLTRTLQRSGARHLIVDVRRNNGGQQRAQSPAGAGPGGVRDAAGPPGLGAHRANHLFRGPELHQPGGAVDRRHLRRRAERLEADFGRAPTLGAIYNTLARLERKGLVASRLGEPSPVRGGRRKRHYRVLPAGRRAVNEALNAIGRLAEGLAVRLRVGR